MISKKLLFLIMLILALHLLVACTSDQSNSITESNNSESKVYNPVLEEEQYNGQNLEFGVIGEEPDIREEQVNFVSISFEELKNIKSRNFDGVFIMESYLPKAADEEFRKIYEEITVPTFFVGSKAKAVPFMNLNNQISYEENIDRINDSGTYISGLWYPESETITFEFKYPIEDSQFNRSRVEEIYSAVFKTVESEVRQ
ncbi:hypothetical protein [Salipaludibacillus sp. CF4.18]|uniref:hypothetical protein n=1 Tax=Salipaludibacillus sp. CF4.18 TaxID=3373081 RepID=UPI003EE79A32